MYLTRKIDKWLSNWKEKAKHVPALVCGIRQCGKTTSIKMFGEKYYKNIVYMNFWTNPSYISIFDGDLDVDEVISKISLRFPNIFIDAQNTLFFLDEIQECPKARLFFKDVANDGRYDFIGSGSFLGLSGYNVGDGTPIPTGYEDIVYMKTMDFEEFLWANKYTESHIEVIEKFFIERRPVDISIHELFKKLYNQYLCVGGFPEAVSTFIETHNLMESLRVVKKNMDEIMSDFGRRVDKDGNPLFKPNEVTRIRNAFEQIPVFLAKENKRYMVSKIETGSGTEKNRAIDYLQQINVVYKVYNLELPSIPLKGNEIPSQFKLFPTDISILTSMYGTETIAALNQGDLGQKKGAIYEALVLDSLYKADVDAFYFAKESGLEIDFVICYNASCYLVEAKAKNGNTKSAKTVMNNKNHYGQTKLLKIGDYNVGEVGDILTIPHYMVFLLGRKKDLIVEDLSNKALW